MYVKATKLCFYLRINFLCLKHSSGVDFTTPVHLSTVTIPKTDHDSLVSPNSAVGISPDSDIFIVECSSSVWYGLFLGNRRRHVYANRINWNSENLRRNLYRGGIAEETLAVGLHTSCKLWGWLTCTKILIKDDNSSTLNEESVVDTADESFRTPHTLKFLPGESNGSIRQDYTYGRNSSYTPRNGDLRVRGNINLPSGSQFNDDMTFMPDDPSDGVYDESNRNGDHREQPTRPQYEKFAKRTLLISNLPEGTTHADVVDVVRGGMLLDIYIRPHDRTASVSFLGEVNAQEFFRHVKRHDLYIRGKRVSCMFFSSIEVH